MNLNAGANRPGRVPPPFWIAAAAVLAGDLVTKLAVYRSAALARGSVRVLGDWIRLTYIHNAGAAFGLFQGSRWFFIGVSLLSVFVISSLALSGRYRDRWMQIAFGLILGGAAGNLLDRIWLGVVIDFIDVGFGTRRWPIFNVADAGVTLGVILLALRLLAEGKGEEEARDRVPAGGESAPEVCDRVESGRGG